MVREKDGQRKRRKDCGRGEETNFQDIEERNRLDAERVMRGAARDILGDVDEDSEEELSEETSPKFQPQSRDQKGGASSSKAQYKKGAKKDDVDGLEDEFVKVDLDQDDDLEKELAAQFGSSPNKHPGQKPKEKAAPIEDDQVDPEQMKKDMERLQAVRRKREQDKIEREKREQEEKEAQEKAAKETDKGEKDSKPAKGVSSYPDLAEAISKLLSGGKKLSLNQLNQDAAAKKLLKPLLKKSAVKNLNKAVLKDICEFKKSPFIVTEESNGLVYVEMEAAA